MTFDPDMRSTAGVDPGAEAQLRTDLVAAARAMHEVCNNRGRSGNASVRLATPAFDGMLITPSGMDYARLAAVDIVAVDLGGAPRDAGSRIPSSEWRMHAAIYRARHDAGAVVHTHSMFATTAACLGRDIPAFHYMVAVAGGDIRCAPYARFGSQSLADAAVAALAGRRACLLAQHGMAALGSGIAEALRVAAEVETLAEMYWRALQIGEPIVLSAEEMAGVTEQFSTYGQQPRS